MTYIVELDIRLGRRELARERLFINRKQFANILMRGADREVAVNVRMVGQGIDVILRPFPDKDASIHWTVSLHPQGIWSLPKQLYNSTGENWKCCYRIVAESSPHHRSR